MFKKKKNNLKLTIGASVGGVLAAGAIASLAGYGIWKRGKNIAEDKKEEDLAKERMVAEGGLNGNAPAVTSKA
jgi:hypothetical protein